MLSQVSDENVWHEKCRVFVEVQSDRRRTLCDGATHCSTEPLSSPVAAVRLGHTRSVTIQLFFTTFSPTANPNLTANATLNGSSLTFSGTSTIAHTNGTDGIRLLPDNNLAIGGRAAAWLQGTFSILPTRARASPPLLRPVTAPTSPLTVVPG